MDFLDPHARRRQKIRLFIGYFLMALVLVLTATVLVYGAYGYGINTKTGQIIQNGLLFVNSHPGGAEIYLNGSDKNATTTARLTLQSGTYDLTLKKAGYRDWHKTFTLQEHSVARYAYPFLFPTKPVSSNLKAYASQPPLIIETPNQHWLLVQAPAGGLASVNFDEFDLTNLAKPAINLVLPSGLLSGVEQDGASLKLIERSTDNNNFLFEHDTGGKSEFILFDRADPAASLNLNRLFKIDPLQVGLLNKKAKQVLLLNANHELSIATLSSAAISAPVLKQVAAFNDYSGDTIIYMTTANQPTGQIQARIWKSGKSYSLANFKAGGNLLLDSGQYQGTPLYVAGTGASQIDIFQDPLGQISDGSIGRAIPMLAFNLNDATSVSFSPNARFIEAEAGANFAVYDLEDLQNYQYKVAEPLAAPLVWMDGHHLIGEVDGNVFVSEFDNTNHQTLVPTTMPNGALFSADYNHLLTIQKLDTNGYVLVNADMRAGKDLPKSLAPSQ